jgi:hypothetical protein
MGEEADKKKKDKPEVMVPLVRDAVIKRRNVKQDVNKESPLATLQEIFEETDDKDRFIGDTMFWKYFEDIDVERVKDTKSVEYLNLRIMCCEVIFYVVLLIMFSAYAFSMQSTSVYYARQDQLNYWGGCNVETGDCKLQQVKDMNSFWHWMSTELVPKAFTQLTCTTNSDCPDGYDCESSMCKAPEVAKIVTKFDGNEFPLMWSPRFIGTNRVNLLLGTLRIKQSKVLKNVGCDVSHMYRHVYPDCFGRFSESHQMEADYRPRFVPTYLMDAYKFQDEEETQQTSFDGAMASYPGSGYAIDLPVNKSESLEMINDLKNWYWIDRSTRSIMVELSTLNVNTNVIVNSRIVFEFGATGSVTPVHDCSAAQVLFFADSSKAGAAATVSGLFIVNCLLFGVMTAWMLFLMYKTCMNFLGGAHSLGRAASRALKLCKKQPIGTTFKGFKLFFRTFYHFLRYEWNMMDFLILTLWYCHVSFRLSAYGKKDSYETLAPNQIGHPELFMPFSAVMVSITRASQTLAILAILTWAKAFKYLCMAGYFRLLVRILEKCAKELVLFAVVLMVVFFGFAVCFFVAYGSTDNNFSTISGSFLVLFFLLLDGYRVDPWWFAPGKLQIMPIVYFCYIVLIYFVLLNVFLAIVLDVYAFTNHLFVIQSHKYDGKENPMMVFLKTFWNWFKGISLVRNEHEENLLEEDLQIDLERLPGLVRRKWIEKKRKMQRVADEAFAGLTLFPEDEGLLFQKNTMAHSDWMLPSTKMDMSKMLNAQPHRPMAVYEIPQGMERQTISRAQLQRLMDEDESLPLLLGETKAVKVIQKFRKKKPDEMDDFTDEDAQQGQSKFMTTQAEVFSKIDDIERVAPEVELPKIPQIIGFTEDMSHSLSEVQNQFRVQLTEIIEATATLFEHLVELTQGIDAVRTNHEQVIELVKESQAEDNDDYGSSVAGSQRTGRSGRT